MQVNFQRDFFTNQARYRSRDNPCTVPESLRGSLPSGAVILEDKPALRGKPRS